MCLLSVLTVAGTLVLFAAADDAAPAAEAETQSGKWLETDFRLPSADHRMMKLLYCFDQNYAETIDRLYKDYGYGGVETDVPFTDRTIEIGASGFWKLRLWATRSAWMEHENLNEWQKGRPYVNVMSRDAIAKFIDVTHEAYKAHLPRSFGFVQAFFTDEPSLFTSNMTNPIHTGGEVDEDLVPWEDSLPTVFRDMHGYDLLDHAQSLFSGNTRKDKVVRIHFYETVGRMIADNYFGQIAQWCEQNGMKGSGHLLLEEQLAFHVALYGDFMKCLNATGYPGCDLLQVSPRLLMDDETWFGNFVGLKMASSSARNTGKAHVFVEFNPEAVDDEIFRAVPSFARIRI